MKIKQVPGRRAGWWAVRFAQLQLARKYGVDVGDLRWAMAEISRGPNPERFGIDHVVALAKARSEPPSPWLRSYFSDAQ